MGEVLKVIDNRIVKDLRLELNQYSSDPKNITIHIQNGNGRFEMSDNELCEVLAAFLIADFNKRSIKG